MIRPALMLRPSTGRLPFSASLAECLPTSTGGRGIGFCSCLSCLHLLRSSGRSRISVLVSSLRPDGALNHPHYTRTTPAVEVRK